MEDVNKSTIDYAKHRQKKKKEEPEKSCLVERCLLYI